jgi:hypothetical protein
MPELRLRSSRESPLPTQRRNSLSAIRHRRSSSFPLLQELARIIGLARCTWTFLFPHLRHWTTAKIRKHGICAWRNICHFPMSLRLSAARLLRTSTITRFSALCGHSRKLAEATFASRQLRRGPGGAPRIAPSEHAARRHGCLFPREPRRNFASPRSWHLEQESIPPAVHMPVELPTHKNVGDFYPYDTFAGPDAGSATSGGI